MYWELQHACENHAYMYTPIRRSTTICTLPREGNHFLSIARCKDVTTDAMNVSVGLRRSLDPASIGHERVWLPTTLHRLVVIQWWCVFVFEADCESKHMAFTCTRTKNTYVVYGSTWFKCTWSKVFSEVRNSWTYCFSGFVIGSSQGWRWWWCSSMRSSDTWLYQASTTCTVRVTVNGPQNYLAWAGRLFRDTIVPNARLHIPYRMKSNAQQSWWDLLIVICITNNT
jgi:hypothetical protein